MELTKVGFKQTEVGLIPEDWEIVQLESKISVFRGGSPRPIQNYLSRSSEGINWIKIGDTSPQSKFIITSEEKIISEGEKMSRKVFPGDFLLSNSMSFGRPYILKIEGCIHDGWLVLQNYQDSFDTDFLYYILSSTLITNQYKSKAAGSSVLNLNKDLVRSISLITPPTLTEQKAIASALSDVDALISSLDKLISKKKAIKQGAMQELLTPPQKGGKRLAGFSGDWEEKQLGSVCEIKKGQLITESTRIDGLIPVIAGGKKPAYYHSHANRFGKTITISGSGASAGYVAFHKNPIFASDCSTIEENVNYSLEFIYYFLSLHQNQIYKAQTGGAQPHIHPSDLNPIRFYHSNEVSEQKAIANILSDMDLEIESLENKKAKYQEIKQGMMQELLTGKTRLV
jgi:type I restriction enzyme S subunit